MQDAERPSKWKMIIGAIFALLGRLGVVISSFYLFSTVIFFLHSDPARVLRVCLGLGASVLILVGVARLSRDGKWWPKFFQSLPLVVCSFGFLGVLNTVAHIYARSQPVTEYERNWFFICLVGFLICLVIGKRHKKHRHHRRHKTHAT